MTDNITVKKLRAIFQNKRVLFVGDSIMKGIYEDICCSLINNSRSLEDSKELVCNQHHLQKDTIFGDALHVNYTNDIFNIENRILQ